MNSSKFHGTPSRREGGGREEGGRREGKGREVQTKNLVVG